jgi:hypothetical protein
MATVIPDAGGKSVGKKIQAVGAKTYFLCGGEFA